VKVKSSFNLPSFFFNFNFFSELNNMRFLLSFLFSILVFCSLGQLKSPDEFLGYPLGSRFTYHYQLVNYCKYVAAQKPSVAEWISYGQTNEHRELGMLILTKPELKGKLSAIKEQHQQVIQGQKSPSNDLPVIINLSFNVHGNEASGSEAALGAIYDLVKDGGLLTSSTKDFVVLMDPCINPDGRDAYVTQYNRRNFTSGGNADPNDQEHFEGSVSGRHNHFSFDLNRDWVWQTQIETQQRMAFFQSWLPMVHADFHEQGYQNSYYFPPAAKPYLNFISSSTKELQQSVGKSFAALFDQQKWPFFTSEVYDLFYPGYGDTYPMLNGALGMTLEQGGIRGGLQAQKSNADTIRFVDRVNHHRQLAVNLVYWSLTNSESVKSSFYQNHATARTNPTNLYKSYLIPKDEIDKSSDLIRLLKRNRIRIGQVDKDFQSNAFSYQEQKIVPIKASAGDLLISAYQSAAPMIQALLDPTPFLEDSLTYDITAWNLFQIHGIRAYGLKDKASSVTYSESFFVENQVHENHVAYVFKPSKESSSFLNSLVNAGYLVVFNDKKVGFEGQSFEPGHLWVLKKRGSWERMNQLANLAQVKLLGINTYRSQEGADLGSEHFVHVKSSHIAVVVDGTFDVGQQGELAYYLTKQMQLNPSFIPMNQVFKANLSAYSHLIFPNSKSVELSKSQQILLDDYVRKGGQVILFENSGSLVAKNLVLKEKDLTDSTEVQVAYEDSERNNISKTLPGNLLEVQVEKSHPLGFRVNQVNMLLINQADQLFIPNVKWKAILQTSEKPVYFGFMGSKIKPKVSKSLLLASYSMGSGNYIWFGFNPLFRAIPNQSMVLFENSILYHGN
jgi:hypothetical protein